MNVYFFKINPSICIPLIGNVKKSMNPLTKKDKCMKKLLAMVGIITACLNASAQVKSEIKITTSLEYGDSFVMFPKTSSADEPVVVDWGDGELKEYRINPNSSGYFAKVTGRIMGDTIRISSQLTKLDCTGCGITSLFITEQPKLTHLLMSENELTTYQYDLTGAPNLEVVELNANQLVRMDMRPFEHLQNFAAYDNPNLSTVLFADGCESLRSISMNNCDISNFYPVSLPNLSSLSLENNSLMELEIGELYPNLSQLNVAGNYLQAIDVTHCGRLSQINIGNNQIQTLNLGNNPMLTGVFCNYNRLKELNLNNNPEVTRISCNNNLLKKLDLSQQSRLITLECDSNQLARLDLSQNTYLQKIYCKANLLEVLDFAQNMSLNYVDCRFNSKMTACAVNYMFDTMWALSEQQYRTNLLIDGCNAEGADASTITSATFKWKTDIECDGSAVCEAVEITLQPAENGTYAALQPAEQGQKYVPVEGKVKTGTPIRLTAAPNPGYAFKGIVVNGEQRADSVFCLQGASTVGVLFVSTATPHIDLVVNKGQEMSFALKAKSPITVDIDWGEGLTEQYTVDKNWKRIEGVANASDVKITGEVSHANFESFPGMGWDNNLKGIDVSGNEHLVWLSTYMNPIGKLDVSNCTQLTYLDCAHSELSELDVTHATELTELTCYGNQLTHLDVTKAAELTLLNAKSNLLTEIDLSRNTVLEELHLGDNALTEIETAHLENLKVLRVGLNQLTALSVEHNDGLIELAFDGNQLTEIDLDNNTLLQKLTCNDNRLAALWVNSDYLKYLNCEDNGLSACALTDLYYSLSEFPNTEPAKGFSLVVKGKKRPNDAEMAESVLAKGKGWTVNYEGNGDGCTEAYITIKESENGSITLYDEQQQEVVSGQKVAKNSVLTVKADPAAGYQLEWVKANGKAVNGESFSVTRSTDIAARFALQTGIDDESEQMVTLYTEGRTIVVESPLPADVTVWSMQGGTVFAQQHTQQAQMTLQAGIYLVKVSNGHDEVVQKVVLP